MEFLTINTRKRNNPKRIFFSKNNILNKIKARQNSIAGYVQKLNLAGLNDDFDRDAFLKGQYNSDQNILDKDVKKSNTTSKTSRKISLFSSFKSRKSSNITQLSSLFNKKNKSSLSPAKFKTVFGNSNSPFKLDHSNSNSKKNTLIPMSNRRNRYSGLFLTLTDYDSHNYNKKDNFSAIPEQNIFTPVKNINYKFITQTNFFKTKRNLRPKTMDDFFKTADLFNLENAKKIQKKKELKNKINIKQKYPQETFNKLIDNFNINNKKTDNLSKEMIKNLEENIPLFFNKNIEQNKEDTDDIVDMQQLEKQRNSEKVPKIGSTGQINMVNRANSNLIEFGDDYLKLNDIDFYKRGREIMRKYQIIRINAEVKEKPVETMETRHKLMIRNNFLIKKKLDALKREQLKLKDIYKHFE